MTGTSSITNSTIMGGRQRNIAIDSSVGTLSLTVSGNTIKRTSDAAGDDGFFIEADTTANVTLSVLNNTFARHGGDHINVTLVNNAVMDATITGNTLHGNYAGTPEGNHPIGLGQGIFLFGASFNGTFTYEVSNNGSVAVPFRGNRQGGAIHVNKGSGTGTFSGSIEKQTSSETRPWSAPDPRRPSASSWERGAQGARNTTLINNNQVRQYFDRGIVTQAGEGSAALNATVTNNTVSNFADTINSLHGIHSDNGILGRRQQRRLPADQRQLRSAPLGTSRRAGPTSGCAAAPAPRSGFPASAARRTPMPPRCCRRTTRARPRSP